MFAALSAAPVLALALTLALGIAEPADAWTLQRSNPGPLPAPTGSFSRLVVVPAGSDLLFLTGQTGVRPDGTTPEGFADQVDLALANVQAILASEGLESRNLVKVVMYQTVPADDRARVRAALARFVGENRPASALVFVPALSRPEYKFEIDVVAARPATAATAADGPPRH